MENSVSRLQEDNDAMREAILSMRDRSSVAGERSQSSMSVRSNASFSVQTSKSISFIGDSEPASDKEITLAIEDVAVSKMLSNAATQTFDTAFVSCEACARMQQNLVDVGTAMISLCESQGLPSSLAKQKKLLKKSLMAATDVSRWAVEQNRDIERINKHLDHLYNKIEPLKTDLERSRQTCKKLREQVKELSSGKMDIERELVEKETEFCKKIKVLTTDHEKNEKELKGEVEELKTGKESADQLCTQLETENKNRTKLNLKLEKENAKIAADLKVESSEKKRLLDIEKDFHVIKDDLSKVREKLYETEIEMGKTQTENKALSKHNKVIQAKQELLLQRADQLDQECEELQNRLMEVEEEREELVKECETSKQENEVAVKTTKSLQMLVDQKTKEKEDLEIQVKDLQVKVMELETEIQDAKKHLALLSEFPVISHGVGGGEIPRSVEDAFMAKKMTKMSLSDEMSKQVKANNIRIAVLEEQNNTLRNSLAKYEECHSEIPREIPKNRVPLWENGEIPRVETSRTNLESSSSSRHSAKPVCDSSGSNQSLEWVSIDSTNQNPKPPSQPRTSTSKLNEKRQAFVSSSVAVGQKSRSNGNSQSKWSDVAVIAKGHTSSAKKHQLRISEEGYQPTEVYSCPDCDKMYSNQRDLQIHKSFCYANI